MSEKRKISNLLKRLFVVILVMTMVIGSVPADAAKLKTVTVKTVKKLTDAMADPAIGTIKYKTSSTAEITIPAVKGAEKKKIEISAPKVAFAQSTIPEDIYEFEIEWN